MPLQATPGRLAFAAQLANIERDLAARQTQQQYVVTDPTKGSGDPAHGYATLVVGSLKSICGIGAYGTAVYTSGAWHHLTGAEGGGSGITEAEAEALISTYALTKSGNLSELGSASTARTNLGLGSAATQESSHFLLASEKGAASGVPSSVGALAISGTPSSGEVLTATSATAAHWAAGGSYELTEAKIAAASGMTLGGIQTATGAKTFSALLKATLGLTVEGAALTAKNGLTVEESFTATGLVTTADLASALLGPAANVFGLRKVGTGALEAMPGPGPAGGSAGQVLTRKGTTELEWATITTPVNVSKTWSIPGAVAAETIPGPVVIPATGSTIKAVRMDFKIREGTKVKFYLQKAGGELAGFGTSASPKEATTSAAHVTPTAVELAEGEEVTLVIKEVEGSPKGLSVTLTLLHETTAT